MKELKSKLVVPLFCTVCVLTGAHAQLTPSAENQYILNDITSAVDRNTRNFTNEAI